MCKINVSNFVEWTSPWALWVWSFFPGTCHPRFAFPIFWTGRPVSALASQLGPCGCAISFRGHAVPNLRFRLFGPESNSHLASQLGPCGPGTFVCCHAVAHSRFQLFGLDVPFPHWPRNVAPVDEEFISGAMFSKIRDSNFLDWTSRFLLGLAPWPLWASSPCLLPCCPECAFLTFWTGLPVSTLASQRGPIWMGNLFPGQCFPKFAFPTFWTGRPVSTLASQLGPCVRGGLVCCRAVPNVRFQLFGLDVLCPHWPRNLAPVDVEFHSGAMFSKIIISNVFGWTSRFHLGFATWPLCAWRPCLLPFCPKCPVSNCLDRTSSFYLDFETRPL